MAVTVREELEGSTASSATVTLNTDSGTQAGDLLVLVHLVSFYPVAQMLTPTGGGTWTGPVVIARNDTSNSTHIKVWWRAVASGGAQTVTANHQQTDCPQHAHLLVLAGADTTAPFPAGSFAALNNAFGSPQVAPSVTGEDGGLLACGWVADDTLAYTTPGGMTGAETATAFSGALTAYEALTADGATGTRSATTSPGRTHSAVTVAVSPAAAGPGDITGEGASTAPAATAAGTGTVEVAATGAASVPAATSAAAGAVAVSGASDATTPAGVATGTGGVVVSGSGASTAPAGVAAGTGGVGSVPIAGSAASVAPAAVAAGAGTVTVSGSGAAVAPAGVAVGAGFVGDTPPPVVDLNVTIGTMRDGALAAAGTMRATAFTVAGMAATTAVGPMRDTITVGSMRE